MNQKHIKSRVLNETRRAGQKQWSPYQLLRTNFTTIWLKMCPVLAYFSLLSCKALGEWTDAGRYAAPSSHKQILTEDLFITTPCIPRLFATYNSCQINHLITVLATPIRGYFATTHLNLKNGAVSADMLQSLSYVKVVMRALFLLHIIILVLLFKLHKRACMLVKLIKVHAISRLLIHHRLHSCPS